MNSDLWVSFAGEFINLNNMKFNAEKKSVDFHFINGSILSLELNEFDVDKFIEKINKIMFQIQAIKEAQEIEFQKQK